MREKQEKIHTRVGKTGGVETGSPRTAGLLPKPWEEEEREKRRGRKRGQVQRE